jgi:hypothetical protein
MEILFPLFARHGIPGIGLLILFYLILKLPSKLPETALAQSYHFRTIMVIVMAVSAICLCSLWRGSPGL